MSPPKNAKNTPQPIDWERVKSLRGVKRIASALKDLGIPRLTLVSTGNRSGDRGAKVFEAPLIHNELRPFCALVQENPQGKERCQQTCFASALLNNQKLDNPHVHTCHAGLKNWIVPLDVDDHAVGHVGLGQALDSHDDATRANVLEHVGDLKLDPTQARQTLEETPEISDEKSEILTTLVQSIGTEIQTFRNEERESESRRNKIETSNFHGVLTRNGDVRNILNQLGEIAKSNSSVMIYGESGTGKERLASIVHHLSPRKEEGMVTINCAALTESILEAELFGFKKGSFTNAYSDKEGLFEKANRGTMFLDEIGDMPISLQVKLLRVLQEGTFIKVGDTEGQTVDVRIIAATNKNIPDLVERKQFRQDLYYRLAVIELNLPPLRQRPEDVDLLIDFYLTHYCEKMNKPGIRFTQESTKFMQTYEWPGNIRELQNEIERAVALSTAHSIIEPPQLSKRLTELKPAIGNPLDDKRTIKEMVSEYEKAILIRALQQDKWNKTRISEKLGLTRQGLMKKIEKYQLDKRKR